MVERGGKGHKYSIIHSIRYELSRKTGNFIKIDVPQVIFLMKIESSWGKNLVFFDKEGKIIKILSIPSYFSFIQTFVN